MKQLIRNILTLLIISLCSFFAPCRGQEFRLKTGLNALPPNYTTFSSPYYYISAESEQANKAYADHPEAGRLFAETPCNNCYELIGSRTEYSKTYVKEGTGGRDVIRQTSTLPMHYKDRQGNWRTIQTALKPIDYLPVPVYGADDQEIPVSLIPFGKLASLGTSNEQIRFNRNLELVWIRPDGSEQDLGSADYSHYTAGDQGMMIYNAWEGIDIEMRALRGAVKTNYYLRRPMAAYAGGSLVIRDHPLLPEHGHYKQSPVQGDLIKGPIEIINTSGQTIYVFAEGMAFEKKDSKNTEWLAYRLRGDVLDLVLPGRFLDLPADRYPVVIDPLVTAPTTVSVGGSSYSRPFTTGTGCTYTNPATVPAGVTVTDVQFTFDYQTSGGAHINNGADDFHLGSCRSPSASGFFWTCTDTGLGTCTESGVTIFPEIAACIPPPSCTSYNLNIVMDFYQNYAPTSACSGTYISALTPLTVTVFGHTADAAIVASPATICAGGTATLTATSAYGVAPLTYTWMPGSMTGPSVTVNPTSTTIYTLTVADGCGNSSTTTTRVTVAPIGPINGLTTLCVGATTALSDTGGAGTWTSSNTAKATVSSTGVVTGIAKGTSVISYVSAAGCAAPPVTVTVKLAVAPINGAGSLCQGSTISLSDTTSSGTWSSGTPGVLAVSGSTTTSVAVGLSGGVGLVSYTTYGAGCYAVRPITVNPLGAITGITSICLGGTTTLSDAAPGGTWVSTNPAIASISSTGFVTGLSGGSTIISYTTPASCLATASVNVNLLSPIMGTLSICQGTTTSLSHATSGGTWSSGNPAVAAVDPATGLVNGLSGGVAPVSYVLPGGCTAIALVTINAIPAFTGPTAVCLGGTATLGTTVGAGSWSSSNPVVATVGSGTGLVSGFAVGVATLNFTSAAGCSNSETINVNLPTPITGITTVCQGGNVTLSNITPGGTWSSSNTSIATVGASTGVVTGVAGGSSVISYANPSGCLATIAVMVNATAPIAGPSVICTAGSAVLHDAIAAGTWLSSVSSIASIDAATGNVSGLSPGSTTISYTNLAGCTVSTTLTVSVPAPITGPTTICQHATATLSNAISGGTWTSTNPAVATIDSVTGLVSGVGTGITTILYTTSGSCSVTALLTVNPAAPITGTNHLCTSGLTVLANTVSGGTWSSSNALVAAISSTGTMSGMAVGTATISYTTLAGCVATFPVTVSASPMPISGPTILCTTTTYTDPLLGGMWASSDPTVVTIVPGTGMASGLAAGVATISYSVAGGCFVTLPVTVDPLLTITGPTVVCQGSTTTLSYPNPGGTWRSANTAIATVDPASGLVTGIGSGSTIISYTTVSGCIATVLVTVHPILPISGSSTLCQTNTTVLTDPVPGGTWTSDNPGTVPVGATTGVAGGLAAGTATIIYTSPAGCVATLPVTVYPLSYTTGPSVVCAGSTITLSNLTPGGGTWSTLTSSIAAVDPFSGLVTGLTAGVATIRFTSGTGCAMPYSVTVNPLPGTIGGSLAVCAGSNSALSNPMPGGSWGSNNTAIAVIGASSGILSGILAGTVTLNYTSPAGCTVYATATVNPLPMAIYGAGAICAGDSTLLSDSTSSGIWTCTSGVATVNRTTGMVRGISAGSASISFTTPAGCYTTYTVTVNAVPSAIIGSLVICSGQRTALSNSLPGGTWESSVTAIATIDPTTGLASGLTGGLTGITYTMPTGCYTYSELTVNPSPNISSYSTTNPTTCLTHDGTIRLTGLVAGVAYTVTYTFGSTVVTALYTADGAGNIVLTGLAAGNYTSISVTSLAGCSSNVLAGPVTLSLPPNPAVPVAGSNSPLCTGSTLALNGTDATTGVTYAWSGPGGFSSTLQNPTLTGTTLAMAGIYSVTATSLGCVSGVGTTVVVVHPTPDISGVFLSNPTTCQGADGMLQLQGLLPGVSYTVAYKHNSSPVTANFVADAGGIITLRGLTAGVYSNITVTSFACVSNTAGPEVLADPNPPPTPILHSNSPVCAGRTLILTEKDTAANLTYKWAGPNGYTSDLQDPVLPDVQLGDSGMYTLTVMRKNCSSSAGVDVAVYPGVVLTQVTPDTLIPLGGKIQLYAAGAAFYDWAPNDGTLTNPNIQNPWASPETAEVYSVTGLNSYGCSDTGVIHITIDDNITEFLPNAFTPNNDGRNDIFRIVNAKYDKLVEFSIYNRWGQRVYHNEYEIDEGWDGRYHGVMQDVGSYFYNIIVTRPDGTTKNFKGEVLLLR